MSAHPTLTIGILTLNEAHHIANCISSAQWSECILVIDSGSSDQTVSIAKSMGATVISQPHWQGFAHQRNQLLQHVRTDYIFFLDADEILTPELSAEIRQAVANNIIDVGQITWLEIAFGEKLIHLRNNHGVSRLFKTTSLLEFSGFVHETYSLNVNQPKVVCFKNRLPHYSRESVVGSLRKLAQYVQHGAMKRKEANKKGGVLRGTLSACIMFIKLYFFRHGWRDGACGFLFCYFIALECFFRYAAIKYDSATLSIPQKR